MAGLVSFLEVNLSEADAHVYSGSFLEFLGLMTLLKDRYKPSELPYHIIVPSLPGWAFSCCVPLTRDFVTEDIADIMNSLMVGLGFDTYVAQGGDVGSYVARMMGVRHDNCKAVHGTFAEVLQSMATGSEG